MILVIIICGILYLFMIYGVLYLYYTYNKDYNDLEYRILQLEKRDNMNAKYVTNCFMELYDMINEKEGDNMACKKGRGGRKR